MKTYSAVRWALAIVAGSISFSAVAADRLSFEGFAGLEYDGRIRVDELDLDQREGDFVALVETKLRSRPLERAKGLVTLGYDFSQRSHFDFPDLNRQSHRVLADAKIKIGRAEVGAAYDFLHFRLGGDALLNIQGIEPKLSVPIAERTTLSASYRYEHWNFVDLDARDSKNNIVAVGVTHQFAPETQLTTRARHERANAVEPRFDFHGFQLNATLQFPVRLLERRGSARLEYEYRERDYDNVTPSIAERRREDRSILTATAEVLLSERVGLRSTLRYTDRNSNFPASNYEEIRASMGVVVRL
jgi:hypothetical protein